MIETSEVFVEVKVPRWFTQEIVWGGSGLSLLITLPAPS